MRYYETLYIIKPDLSEEDYRGAVEKFSDLIGKNNGVVTKVDEWGTRTLAYEVKKFNKGSYVLLQYCGEPGITEELKREMTLDDRVIKYQTIKLSDDVDPETLKAAGEEGTKEAEEAVQPVEETEEKDGDKDGV